MNTDILMVFQKFPAAVPLFEAAQEKILAAFPTARVEVRKTQISFYNRHLFAALWPPTRRFPGRKGNELMVTFGLSHQVEHPRVMQSVEPYPNRWTHHVVLAAPEELDQQLMDWLQEAYDFSMIK